MQFFNALSPWSTYTYQKNSPDLGIDMIHLCNRRNLNMQHILRVTNWAKSPIRTSEGKGAIFILFSVLQCKHLGQIPYRIAKSSSFCEWTRRHVFEFRYWFFVCINRETISRSSVLLFLYIASSDQLMISFGAGMFDRIHLLQKLQLLVAIAISTFVLLWVLLFNGYQWYFFVTIHCGTWSGSHLPLISPGSYSIDRLRGQLLVLRGSNSPMYRLQVPAWTFSPFLHRLSWRHKIVRSL